MVKVEAQVCYGDRAFLFWVSGYKFQVTGMSLLDLQPVTCNPQQCLTTDY